MNKKFKAALVGFGKISSGYASDELMAKFYRYSTHAQVLSDHPNIEWEMVIDPDENALDAAKRIWNVPKVYSSIENIFNGLENIEILILATPPEIRTDFLEYFPNLKAVLVEKPMGLNFNHANEFVMECEKRNLFVQVNLWRRADRFLRKLAKGELANLLGDISVAFCVYGNGFQNNGIHMVDVVRMLFGEIQAIQKNVLMEPYREGPIQNDINLAFQLMTHSNILVNFVPIEFKNFRENSLDIWGTQGRLQIMNEGLVNILFKKEKNRAMRGTHEICSDEPIMLDSSVGDALYQLYQNLISSLEKGSKEDLFSSAESALVTTEIVQKITNLPGSGGELLLS